jgi:endo-alpha-1,4-polygalactosaminidase (GH114 family)
MFKTQKKWEQYSGMSKIVIIIMVTFLMIGCSKDKIKKEIETIEAKNIYISNIDESIDYITLDISYDEQLYDEVEIRVYEEADSVDTEYDGIVLDNWNGSTIKQIRNKAPLNVNTEYYYSLFYTLDSCKKDYCKTKAETKKTRTLTHKQGMQKLIKNLIDYSRSKSTKLNHLISTNSLDIIMDENKRIDNSQVTINTYIDGYFIEGNRYKGDSASCTLDADVKSGIQKVLSKEKAVFTLNLCNTNLSETIIKMKQANNITSTSNLNGIENSNATINSLENIKDFAFIKKQIGAVDTSTIIKENNYDMFIIPPYKIEATERLMKTDIIDIEKRDDTHIRDRLILAYINIGKGHSSSFYYNIEKTYEWNNSKNWDWIEQGTNKTNYWYKEWETELKAIIDTVHSQGYDGIVFDGVDEYITF